MKKTLFFLLLLIPAALFAQTGSGAHFIQRDYVSLGKLPVYGTLGDIDVYLEYVTDLNTNTRFINLSCTNAAPPPVNISLEMPATDIDAAITAVTAMIEKMKIAPTTERELVFQSSNGFEIKAYWDGKAWFGSFDDTSTPNISVSIKVTRFPDLIALLQQAKTK